MLDLNAGFYAYVRIDDLPITRIKLNAREDNDPPRLWNLGLELLRDNPAYGIVTVSPDLRNINTDTIPGPMAFQFIRTESGAVWAYGLIDDNGQHSFDLLESDAQIVEVIDTIPDNEYAIRKMLDNEYNELIWLAQNEGGWDD